MAHRCPPQAPWIKAFFYRRQKGLRLQVRHVVGYQSLLSVEVWKDKELVYSDWVEEKDAWRLFVFPEE